MSIDNAMLVKVTVRRVSNGLIDKEESIRLASEKGIDPSKCKVTKKILDHPKIKEIHSDLGRAERELKYWTSPWLDNGTRILATANYMKIVEIYNKHKNLIVPKIEEAEKIYQEFIEDDRRNLGDLYDEGDYPRHLSDKIGIEIDFYPIPTSSDFRVQLKEDEVKIIREQLDNKWQVAQDKMVKDLWDRLQKLVSTMSDTLSKDNPKIYDSLTGNIKQLAEAIPDMDLTNNPELDKIRQECLRKLTNWSKESLKNPHVKKQVQEEAAAIAQKMVGYF